MNEKNRALKLKILKAARAIRKKHMQLKLGRVETNELLEKTFKPIVEPLTKLDSTFKHEMESIKEPLLEMAAKHDESDQPSTPPSTPQQTSTLRPYVGTPLQEYFNTYEALPRSYIRGLLQARSKAYDTTFGPILDLNTNQIKMGKTILNFVKNDIVINEKLYKGTEGLYELLFKAQPKNYTEEDKDSYRKILLETYMLHRNFHPANQMRGSKSLKYGNIIKPLISHNISGEGHMVVSAKPYQYVYWDNVNELVDRLKLLTASQTAGNTNHNNEIMSIIEELREADVVQ